MASHFFYYLSALIGLMIIWVCYREIRRLGAAAIQYLASYLALKEEGGRRQQRMQMWQLRPRGKEMFVQPLPDQKVPGKNIRAAA